MRGISFLFLIFATLGASVPAASEQDRSRVESLIVRANAATDTAQQMRLLTRAGRVWVMSRLEGRPSTPVDVPSTVVAAVEDRIREFRRAGALTPSERLAAASAEGLFASAGLAGPSRLAPAWERAKETFAADFSTSSTPAWVEGLEGTRGASLVYWLREMGWGDRVFLERLAAQTDDPYEARYAALQVALDARDWEAALGLAQEILDAPDAAPARGLRYAAVYEFRLLWRLGRRAAARDAATVFLERWPESPYAPEARRIVGASDRAR